MPHVEPRAATAPPAPGSASASGGPGRAPQVRGARGTEGGGALSVGVVLPGGGGGGEPPARGGPAGGRPGWVGLGLAQLCAKLRGAALGGRCRGAPKSLRGPGWPRCSVSWGCPAG